MCLIATCIDCVQCYGKIEKKNTEKPEKPFNHKKREYSDFRISITKEDINYYS